MPSSQVLALVPLALLVFCACAYAQAPAADDVCADPAADDPCHNVPKALRLKLIAVPAILVSSVLGVCLPLFARSVPALQPGRSLFSVVKAFASGVILATGYMHVLPDSFDSLSSPCLPKKPWSDFPFPFTAFVAMLAALFTLAVDSLMLTFYNRNKVGSGPSTAAVASHESPEQGAHWHSHGHEHAPGHAHGMMLNKPEDAEAGQMQLHRNRVVVQVILRCTCTIPNLIMRLLIDWVAFHNFFLSLMDELARTSKALDMVSKLTNIRI
jgi:solute carrier family 39 (zinc transporter), member 1/2/3